MWMLRDSGYDNWLYTVYGNEEEKLSTYQSAINSST